MNEQTQKATGQAIAVQSGRDTTINQGVSREDMKLIIDDTIAAQLPIFAAMAREVVSARLDEFKESVIGRFEDAKATDRDAFKDPDFQYLLGRAEHAYARSGDTTVRETLVDLIAQRSKQKGRTRLALSLNEAVERAAVMTKNEFAELSLCYLLRYTQQNNVGNLDLFAKYFTATVCPLLPDVSEEESSYSYLESQSCASVTMMTVNLHDVWKSQYGGLFSKGMAIDQLKDALPADKKTVLDGTAALMQCLNDSAKLQLKALNKDTFKKFIKTINIALSDPEVDLDGIESTMWSNDEMLKALAPTVPCIEELFRLWNTDGTKPPYPHAGRHCDWAC